MNIRLLPSHLYNIQASIILLSVCRQLILLSVCRQLTFVFFLVARDSRSMLRSPLAPSSVGFAFFLRTSAIFKQAWLCLLPSHLGNIQASLILLSVCRQLILLSVCRQLLSYSIFFLPLSSLRTGQLSVRNDDRGRPSQKRSPSAQLWKA